MNEAILILEEATDELAREAQYYMNIGCFAIADVSLNKLEAYKEVLGLLKAKEASEVE